MKKINNIKQLQAEKNRIIRDQEELENKIRSDWKDIKVSLKPDRIIGDSFIDAIINSIKKEVNGERVLKSTFMYGTGLLARKLVSKAVQRAGRFFRNNDK